MRTLHEVVELTCTCELGIPGERAVVTEIDGRYMTLTFTGESRSLGTRLANYGARVVRTGTDYEYLRSVLPGKTIRVEDRW